MQPNTPTQPTPGADLRRPRPMRPIDKPKGGSALNSLDTALDRAIHNLAAAGVEFVEIHTHHPTRSTPAEPAAA